MAVVVGPSDPHSTHHVALVAENGQTIGLILCDAQGKRLPYSIARSNLQSLPIKTASGESQYSDLEPPFTVSQQSSWESGQGQRRFEDNKAKYARGRRIQTVNGKLTLGPLEHYTETVLDGGATTTGLRASTGWLPLEDGGGTIGRWLFYRVHSPGYWATRFKPLTDTPTEQIWMMGREGSSGTAQAKMWHWEVCADDAGGAKPGTVLDFGDFNSLTRPKEPVLRWGITNNDTPITLTAGTYYWFKVFPHVNSSATDHSTMCYLSGGNDHPQELSVKSTNNTVWATNDKGSLMFRITSGGTIGQEPEFGGYFFYYQKGLYFVTSTDGPGATAPRLFLNGWRGAADSNVGALTKLKDATQTAWAENRAAGSVAVILGGPGSEEDIPYRYVVSSASGEATVTPAWLVEHTTATNYVLIGAEVWNEITGHGMTQVVNDEPIEVGSNSVSKKDMMCYFTQGRNAGIRVLHEYNSAGTWTREWRTWNPTERCEFLILVEDATDGWTIWKAEQGSITGVGALAQKRAPDFNYADFAAGPQAFGADELIGHDKNENIVNFVEYQDPDSEERIPWAICENRLVARRSGKWRSIKLDELRAFASRFTGNVALVKDTYLYLSMSGGLLEQLTNGVLVDMGPGKGLDPGDGGLGETQLECGETYPGTMWVSSSIRGSSGHPPLVFQHRGNDAWECLYSGAPYGGSIRAMKFQKVPDAGGQGKVGRLWIQQGADLVWLEVPRGGMNALDDVVYQTAPEGAIETSKVFAELDDRNKVYSSLKFVTEGLNATVLPDFGLPKAAVWVEVDRALDIESRITDESSGAWTYLGADKDFTTSPSQEEYLTDYFTDDTVAPLRGKYLKLRLRINNALAGGRPAINGMLIESVVGLPVKFSFSLTSLFEDRQVDLENQPETDSAFLTASAKLRVLDDYADGLQVFTLRCIAPALHGKKVVIGAPQFQPHRLSKHAAETENQRTVEGVVATIGVIQLVVEPAA